MRYTILPKKTMRKTITSNAPWETTVGYSRAVRVGGLIEVSGTTAVLDGELQHPNDFYQQARIALDIIRKALEEAGAGVEDVVRTRMFVTDITQWEAVGRAHGEVFGKIRPATTMVEVSALITPGMVVEIEATAYLKPDTVSNSTIF